MRSVEWRDRSKIVGQGHVGNCAMPKPFFGHKSCAKLAPGRYTDSAGICAADAHDVRTFLQYFAGNRLKEFTLAIAGNPGNSENFTAMTTR